jgi:hypothetical protein
MFLIRCKIRRLNGTVVDLDGTKYHFKPIDNDDPASEHVCNVMDPKHQARFLSIPESFVFHRATGEAEPETDTDSVSDPDEKIVSDEDQPGYDAMQRILNAEDLTSVDEGDVTLAHQFLIGSKPHHRAKIETSLEKIIDAAVDEGYLDSADAYEMKEAIEASTE